MTKKSLAQVIETMHIMLMQMARDPELRARIDEESLQIREDMLLYEDMEVNGELEVHNLV